MKKLFFSLLAVASFAASAPAAFAGTEKTDAAATDGKSDAKAIKAAVYDYFHGQGQGSAERLNRAFVAEHASMVGVVKNDAGEPAVRSWKDMGEVLANWSQNPTPDAPDRDGEILDMHVQDGRIATVMFRSRDRFYDALTLAKVDGEWRIIAKAFVLQ
ncbi:MAG: nuclear transport factor 2 family protein [Pseudomonadota bacterium]